MSKTKTYSLGEKKYSFDFDELRRLIWKYKNRHSQTMDLVFESLGDSIRVDSSTVQNWYKRKNAPQDLSIVAALAKVLGIQDEKLLLKEVRPAMKNNTITITSDMIAASVKKVTDAIMDFLTEFDRTNGFNDLWSNYWEHYELSGIPDETRGKRIEGDLYSFAEAAAGKVYDIFEKERLILKLHPICEELDEFIYGDEYGLWNIYDGKLSYAYRFEAPVERKDGTPSGVTTEEDYERYYKKLKEILEPYLTFG